MARKKTIKFNSTTLYICIAIAVILALLVALAFSPVGQSIIDSMGESGSSNGGSGSSSNKTVLKLGSDLTVNESVVLDNVTCQIHFINVYQGDGILVRFSDGTDILIDGGSTTSGLETTRENFVQYLFDAGITSTIDYLIITHPDTDHYNMLTAVMESFVIENVIYNNVNKNQTYSNFIARIGEEVSGAHKMPIDADGDNYQINGTGYAIDIYAPGYDRFNNADTSYDAEESNGMSPIIVLTTGGTKVLLTGDATEETEAWFIDTFGTTLDVDILKVGHHGSNTSSSEAFLDFINAEYAVISCDDGKAYEHPSATIMNRLFNEGMVTYRTNRHGDIVLSIDEDGDFAFEVENEITPENNSKGINDKMIITSTNP
ncbi:MAG: hypothetical protein J6R35_01680 [Clostridia bacterium]|nr:hypothetical protein [Clostridia bacterium]